MNRDQKKTKGSFESPRRAIKFRAWDKSTNEMLQQPLDSIFGASRLLGFVAGGNIEIMQYTGLKDKNGKEIYEGDIVTGIGEGSLQVVPFYGDVVVWLTSGWGVNNELAGKVPLHMIYGYEIIGNIYENPELLEQK